jgi:hypothetical protein
MTTTDPITAYLETQPLNRMRLHFYKLLGIQPCTDPKWIHPHEYGRPPQFGNEREECEN